MNICSNTFATKSLTKFIAVVGLAVALLLPGPARAEGKRPVIVATTGMVADLVRAVAGDRAAVEALMGEGVDPHLFKPTRSDTVRLLRADAVFISGLHLEGKMTGAFDRLRESGKPVVALGEAVPEDRLLSPPEFEGAHDPHIWMDVGMWARTLPAIRDGLTRLDPAGAETYARNAGAYGEELARLDAYARRILSSIPRKARILVTAHDAFNYLGRAYGIEVRGIQGISTESEAGLRIIEELAALLADRGVPAVFPETSVSDRNVRALVEGAGARGHPVTLGGALFSDAMGAPGSYEGTYIGMIDHNVTTIARALGGDAPAGGFQGKLALAQR
ncbi:metal ABC transporter solute-binding protein, Zn/Mn family [Azospirillum isscasi]|uniref:Zinc ABC transporter substrate-binding protein n=1 Tax=Azospirillum isscasi TaxID=3053926 RepID=A0ABU0WNU8_9PROT|nr:zinc ABC transporter substrate-binding protein [Azospirillum isscasi]MDQ2105914.1 zinc ABC transporter substrate-binding protein [Azospirillum isscasi]